MRAYELPEIEYRFALGWIALRSWPDVVAAVAPESDLFRFGDKLDSGTGLLPEVSAGSDPALEIDIMLALRRPGVSRTALDARNDLTGALRGGLVAAYGQRPNGGDLVSIPPLQWHALELTTRLGETIAADLKSGAERWGKLRFARSDILACWRDSEGEHASKAENDSKVARKKVDPGEINAIQQVISIATRMQADRKKGGVNLFSDRRLAGLIAEDSRVKYKQESIKKILGGRYSTMIKAGIKKPIF